MLHGIFIAYTQLFQLVLGCIVIKLVSGITVDFVEDYNIKFIFQGVGQHLIISVALGQLAAAFSLVNILANDKIPFTLTIVFAGTHLRINGFFALHVTAEARVDYCSKHKFTPLLLYVFSFLLQF